MNIIFLLIIISMSVALLFLIGFLWAVNSGQYEDDVTPGMRIIMDDKDKI